MENTNTNDKTGDPNSEALEMKDHLLQKEAFKKKILFEDWKAISQFTLRRSPFLKDFRISLGKEVEPLLPITRVLKSTKRVQKLELQLNNKSFEVPPHFLQAIKHAQEIENLTFNFRGDYCDNLGFISKNPKSFKNLKSLKVKLFLSSGVLKNKFKLSELWPSMKACKKLSEFCLRFSTDAHLFDEKTIQAFFQVLKSLKQLDKLIICIEGSVALSKEESDSFAKGIGLLNPLTQLSIWFRDKVSLFSNKSQVFCSSLLNHPDLRKLSLERILDSHALDSFGLCLQQLLRLTSFTLDSKIFDNHTDRKIQSFMRKLQSLPSLAHLDLQLSSPKHLTDIFFSNLISELMYLPNLKSLSLATCGYHWKVENNGFWCLSKGLYHLSSLVSLSLLLNSDIVKDSEMKSVFVAINRMENLKSLSLIFQTEKDCFGDNTMTTLASIFPSLKQLSSLNLGFRAPTLTSLGIRALSESLKSMVHLRELTLTFLNPPAGDDFLTTIMTGITNMRLLSQFSLQFYKQKLNERETKILIETLKSLKYLKRIKLHLNFGEFRALLETGLNQGRFLRTVIPHSRKSSNPTLVTDFENFWHKNGTYMSTF